MAKKWEVQFKTISDKTVTVSIHEDWYNGDVIELEAAPNCVEWEEEDDEDVMKPVRTQTGYLRVMDNGDLDGLLPANNRERYVEVEADGEVVWIGYIAAEAYSEPWDITPKVVELPLLSPLAILEGEYMDGTKDMGMVTLGGLLGEIVAAVGYPYSSIVYPMSIADKDNHSDWAVPFKLEVARFNFFKRNDSESREDSDWKAYDGMTCKEVLEEICKLWGWTCLERGRTLIFRAAQGWPGHVKVGVSALSQWALGESYDDEEYVYGKYVAAEELEWMDTDHQLERLQGYSKVTVTGELNALSEDVTELNIDELEDVTEYTIASSTSGRGLVEYIYVKEWKNEWGTVEAKMYDTWGGQPIAMADTWEGLYLPTTKGALLTNHILAGWASRGDDAILEEKESKSVRIFLRSAGGVLPTEDEAKASPVLTLKKREAARMPYGYIVIEGKTQGLKLAAEGYTETETNGKMMLPISVRIGDLWWNGGRSVSDGWQTTKGVVQVRCGDQEDTEKTDGEGKIVSNRSWARMFDGDGYGIPVAGTMEGDVEVIIYPPWQTDNDVVILTDLTIRFAEAIGKKPKKSDNTYRSQTDNGFKGQKEVELKMTSNASNAAGYGMIVSKTIDVQHLWYEWTGEELRPEVALLGTLKRVFGRSIEKIRLHVRADNTTGAIDWVTAEGRPMRVMSESVNVAEEVKTLVVADMGE